jgi:hypothetical protein
MGLFRREYFKESSREMGIECVSVCSSSSTWEEDKKNRCVVMMGHWSKEATTQTAR